eukprot:TRINITY_DN68144_c5_g3_i14.p1 TRINITY_DN68144_c5_g3~~TRINITY_DN68144_c5_g3_i14.p1  ORF type:complete len:586 (-),score=83.83 TRINITY_DN68144_c5_g3_i14:257-2014(-)
MKSLARFAMRRSGIRQASTHTHGMFCNQCEQTMDNTGCTTLGVCGKNADVSALQDLLMHAVKGISLYANESRALGKSNPEVDKALPGTVFTTLTNVNFDPERFVTLLKDAQGMLDTARTTYLDACKEKGMTPVEWKGGPTNWTYTGFDQNELIDAGATVSVRKRKEGEDPDVFAVKEMITFALKGLGAYAEHARRLGQEDPEVYSFITRAFAELCRDDATLGEMVSLALEAGAVNLRVLQLLDAGHSTEFGTPEPTQVALEPVEGKCLLVSGHDIGDLYEILKQTEGKGINVYTHGELLPAHGYPEIKKFKHLKGNYGGAWQDQRHEFAEFPGAIVLTSNCLIKPMRLYMKRIFTTSVVGWPGVTHISDNNYAPAIEAALEAPGFTAEQIADGTPQHYTHTGFGHAAVLGLAGDIIGAIKEGKIGHFYVIGGCDGGLHYRTYFRELALSVPKNGVIVTLGCGKYRFNKEDFGNVEGTGIPRLIDCGQCNDSYSAVQIAVGLANALGVESVNDLPIHFAVSWFEQKAVAVLCTLLHLGIKNIHLGPALPGFLTPNVLNFLVEKYNIQPTLDGKADAEKFANSPNNN